MKKFTLSLALILLLFLSACSATEDAALSMQKEGIAPFVFSEREDFLLSAFSMKQNVALFTCKAPKDCKSVELYINTLNDTGTWDTDMVGAVYRPLDEDPPFEGTIAMVFGEDNSIELTALGFSTHIPAPNLGFTPVAQFRSQLPSFEEITLNEVLPLIVTVKDAGGSMDSFTLDDFATPEKFTGMDFVQVLTVKFSDQAATKSTEEQSKLIQAKR